MENIQQKNHSKKSIVKDTRYKNITNLKKKDENLTSAEKISFLKTSII